jgi:hypothetical protein
MSLVVATACLGCQGSVAPGGAGDAGSDADQGCSTGVCATAAEIGPGVVCASQHATTACLGGTCCVLGPDSGVATYGDGGTCPGECASPDDIACKQWSRVASGVCGVGDLCCTDMVDY